MHTLKIRNLTIGSGIPAVCVPNIGRTESEILAQAKRFTHMPMDLMEWRADWFEEVKDTGRVVSVLGKLRKILMDIPLLFTFRTENEGGNCPMKPSAYAALNKAAAFSGMADMIDIELFVGDALVKELIEAIHTSGAKVILSNHDFKKTPDKSELIRRLRRMQDMGADIPKLAVMPQTRKDVLTLLEATEEMAENYADRPIITMSMSGLGSISRIACEVFGSCLTFASGTLSSAPGQLNAEELYPALQMIHQTLKDL